MPLGIRAEWLGCLAQRRHGAASSAVGPEGGRVKGAAGTSKEVYLHRNAKLRQARAMELELQKSSYRSCGYDHDGRLCHALPQPTVRALALNPRKRFFPRCHSENLRGRPPAAEFDCDRNDRATWIYLVSAKLIRDSSQYKSAQAFCGFSRQSCKLPLSKLKLTVEDGSSLGSSPGRDSEVLLSVAWEGEFLSLSSLRAPSRGELRADRAESRPLLDHSGRRLCFTCACSKRRSLQK